MSLVFGEGWFVFVETFNCNLIFNSKSDKVDVLFFDFFIARVGGC